ncbi:diguanylate cyclase (GGDEF domain) with PAS/PAC sensor [hydrothermal vent metagenome]|uniref:Diguanylate cyclase (GGDEF domain) with PAS/PAC sensor n=1 Tax=hydrothermal vent metagenome TaxID=652676 RepID=A0A3B0ZR59_9ZZZZ
MPKDPISENKILRHRLDEFVAEARKNERKMRRFQSLELKLIGLSSVKDLIEAVLTPDYSTFRWDEVTLLLLDPEYEIQRALEDEGVELSSMPHLMFASSDDDLNAYYQMSLFPTLGAYRARQHSTLFPARRRTPRSVALLPLVRQGKLIGSLNVGSYSAERFERGVRTDFFEHLSAIVSICLENAVNIERLKRQGLTDTLTAINNRRFFDQRLKEEVGLAKRNKRLLSCMLLDVDLFKNVNDTYGHQVGDLVLRDVAALIRAQMRGSDVLSRYGGEEFSALLSQADEEEALEVAERIRESIEQHLFSVDGHADFNVTISIGVTTFNPALNGEAAMSMQGEHLVGEADKALYAAKANGRNRVESASGLELQEDGNI